MDMSRFTVAKSDQLNADDLQGGPRVITVTGVRGTDASDQPVAINYEGDGGKPFKPCKSMRRVMVHCWGKDAASYAGKSMELYCDPDVQFGGMKVGGIRIRAMSHIDGKKQMALTATRGKKGIYTVVPLANAPTDYPDYSAQLAVLESATSFGEDALKAKWQEVGPEVRKALAGELDRLKSLVPAAQPQQQEDDGYAGV